MSSAIVPIPDLDQLPPLPVYRFSPEQFQRLLEEGIVARDEPLEFRDGLLLSKDTSVSSPPIEVMAYPGTDGSCQALPVRRFTLDEYHRLAERRILGPEDGTELLEGWIVRKMTFKPAHPTLVALTLHVIGPVLPKGWHCRGQAPVTTDTSEPEPDVSVVKGQIRDYLDRHPDPSKIAVAIEIADSSLCIDRQVKCPHYARNRIPVYWIINIPDQRIEVYSDPTGPRKKPDYRQRRDYGSADEVPLVIEGREVARIPARELLP